MLETGELWMRNVRQMNDSAEVSYGINGLLGVRSSYIGRGLVHAISSAHPGLGEELLGDHLNGVVDQWYLQTHVACVTEHDPMRDFNGRLSMWRAYGSDTGIAFVLKGDKLLANENYDHLYLRPVDYAGELEFVGLLHVAISYIERNVEALRALPRLWAKIVLTDWLCELVTCMKHPGFHEEREWRVLPVWQHQEATARLERAVKDVGSVPQIIFVAKLFDQDTRATTLSEMVDRIIVGPSSNQQAIVDAIALKIEGTRVQVLPSYTPWIGAR